MTGVPIHNETIGALRGRFVKRVAGPKDSSGELDHARHWIDMFPELAIFPGSDALASGACAAGVAGTIPLLGILLPEELNGIRAGEAVEERQRLLTSARELTQQFPRHAAVKYLLHLVSGLPRSAVRPPLEELTPEQETELEARLDELRSETRV